ncbi:ABC transporter ATP-binding protein [Methylobacterium sp. J-077]|uniref:ABC transporter ATP-binding protein n=1 Tax=Methylobacterium sp. J-077 TaxID=2836656 RepID=UPI001FBB462E|nr:ABC transporter ATP-binding protein [Methylobacterium sp. J-077]MCJ2125155.1 ABC transporter ATP-binding protein [Methylobacterium sp. J-077]
MAEIAIRNIVKTFTDRQRDQDVLAVDNVSLTIRDNDFVCLLGPSGCGKSTLLNMIAGFETPTSGRIEVAGQIVEKPGADRGVVFQQPTLMPWLTVAENVAFHLKLKGLGRAERRAQAQAFIDLVGLTGFEGHYPSELSGGMNQRVGIARALLMNPRVILMDEPFAALDAQTKIEMQEELVRIWERIRCTIVFVTHSVDEALVLGTRIAVMTRRPGRIREAFDFDLPRPRDVTSPAFNDAKRNVLGLIREEATRIRHAA